MKDRPSWSLDDPPADVRGAHVLVVDDEPAWRLLLETDLRMLGYRVTLADGGREALAKIAETKPAAAIVDLMLPRPLDGPTLLRELRARGLSLPIIAYSADPSVPGTNDDPNVVGFVSKGADRAELFTQLVRAIRASSAPRR